MRKTDTGRRAAGRDRPVGRARRLGPDAPAPFTVSAFNAGIAAGSSIAGYALDSSLGTTGPATVGVAMVTLGVVPLIALAATRASRTSHHEPVTA